MNASPNEPEYRAVFDATVTFSNRGGLTAEAFRVDIPGPGVSRAQVAELFLASLSLLLTDTVVIHNLQVVPEAHRGTRGGPSAPGRGDGADAANAVRAWRYVDLNHVIAAGITTYPGLPGPEITPHLTREASRASYSPGTEFAIDRISMIGNTGTYLDSPYHRFPDGVDLAGLPLERLADLPAVVVRTAGTRQAPYLTEAGAHWLIEHDARLVGIDAVNIDDIEPPNPADQTARGTRPAHTLLLGAGIPVVEHLTGLGQVPAHGARFTAVPPRVAGFGTFPVRAYAAVPNQPG